VATVSGDGSARAAIKQREADYRQKDRDSKHQSSIHPRTSKLQVKQRGLLVDCRRFQVARPPGMAAPIQGDSVAIVARYRFPVRCPPCSRLTVRKNEPTTLFKLVG
jgi:hypothetical protein